MRTQGHPSTTGCSQNATIEAVQVGDGAPPKNPRAVCGHLGAPGMVQVLQNEAPTPEDRCECGKGRRRVRHHRGGVGSDPCVWCTGDLGLLLTVMDTPPPSRNEVLDKFLNRDRVKYNLR